RNPTLAKPASLARRRARSTMGADSSTPSASPRGPTRLAASRGAATSPPATSSTRSPGPIRAPPTATRPSGLLPVRVLLGVASVAVMAVGLPFRVEGVGHTVYLTYMYLSSTFSAYATRPSVRSPSQGPRRPVPLEPGAGRMGGARPGRAFRRAGAAPAAARR